MKLAIGRIVHVLVDGKCRAAIITDHDDADAPDHWDAHMFASRRHPAIRWIVLDQRGSLGGWAWHDPRECQNADQIDRIIG